MEFEKRDLKNPEMLRGEHLVELFSSELFLRSLTGAHDFSLQYDAEAGFLVFMDLQKNNIVVGDVITAEPHQPGAIGDLEKGFIGQSITEKDLESGKFYPVLRFHFHDFEHGVTPSKGDIRKLIDWRLTYQKGEVVKKHVICRPISMIGLPRRGVAEVLAFQEVEGNLSRKPKDVLRHVDKLLEDVDDRWDAKGIADILNRTQLFRSQCFTFKEKEGLLVPKGGLSTKCRSFAFQPKFV